MQYYYSNEYYNKYIVQRIVKTENILDFLSMNYHIIDKKNEVNYEATKTILEMQKIMSKR